MKSNDFIFVGYLIQEPYWSRWPKREGFRVASIEREYHPELNKNQWNSIDGTENPTRFLTKFPHLETLSLEPHKCGSVFHKASPGWVVSGYAFQRNIVESRILISTDGKRQMLEFGYALKLSRNNSDGLVLLGYEVVDTDDIFLSILNNCGYTTEEVEAMGGPLNDYGLLPSVESAEKFCESIKLDKQRPNTTPDHNRGIIVQVWGQE